MIVLVIILAFLYVVIDAVRDNIAHHDSYKRMGYFFSQKAYYGPIVKGFIDKYFPMFRDAWHLGKTIQYAIVATFLGLIFGNWPVFIGWFILSQLLFGFFYTYLQNIVFKALIGIFIILVVFNFFGCKTITNTSEVKKHDSSSVATNNNTSVFDSAAYLAGVKMGTKVINPCDSNGKLKPINQTTTNGHGTSRIYTKHDTLFVDCECEGTVNRLRVEVYQKDSAYKSLSKVAERLAQTEIKEVVKTPWYFEYALAGLAIIILILGLWVLKLKLIN